MVANGLPAPRPAGFEPHARQPLGYPITKVVYLGDGGELSFESNNFWPPAFFTVILSRIMIILLLVLILSI